MPVLIAGSAVRTCLGDGPRTFAALVEGRDGAGPLRRHDPALVGVGFGYEIESGDDLFPAGVWLAECVAEALEQAGVDPARQRTVALVGTGLRELAAVERRAMGEPGFETERLHFAAAVTGVAPGVGCVHTLAGACSAGGHALALAQDLLELGEADAVIVGGSDTMTASMLAMIGRVGGSGTQQVRPFDVDRPGVLLGDGAAALVLVPDEPDRRGLARVLATGMSCDAGHETAPDTDGITRAVRDALARAERDPAQVDLVFAHGTGTALNDPAEAKVLTEIYGDCSPGPLVTAVKGAVGHTSGGSALLSVAMAVLVMEAGVVPPVVGLREPLAEAAGLRLVAGEPVKAAPRTVQVDAFGFGGVNAVTLLEAPA